MWGGGGTAVVSRLHAFSKGGGLLQLYPTIITFTIRRQLGANVQEVSGDHVTSAVCSPSATHTVTPAPPPVLPAPPAVHRPVAAHVVLFLSLSLKKTFYKDFISTESLGLRSPKLVYYEKDFILNLKVDLPDLMSQH